VVVPVAGIVRTTVVSPDRSDFTSARRATRTLATKSEVSAFYCWTCPRCFAVQDTSDPVRCCISPRAMLSVTRPERRRLVLHPAPAPGPVPPWIMLNDAPAAPEGLAAPGLDDRPGWPW
jgi:hypothetical protein